MGRSADTEEQTGLETYHPGVEAPEVVPANNIARRPSQDLPEPVPIQEETGKTAHAHYADDPEQYDGHYSVPPKYEHHEDLAAQLDQDKKRKKRRILIWVGVAVLALIIIVGAVVGGVVGSAAAKKNNNNNNDDAASATSSATSTASSTPNTSNTTSAGTSTPPDSLKVLSFGGVALLSSSDGQTRYAYAQQQSGAVIEIPYINGDWTFDKQYVVTTNANAGASVAATSYSANGTTHRVVAFVTVTGQIMVTSTTGDNVWTQEASILTNDTASNSGLSLAICADTDVLKGIRVYYASSKLKFIREVGLELFKSNAKWTMYTNFTNAEPESGVACSISSGVNHLYYRDGTQIQQWVWSYGTDKNTWQKGAVSQNTYPPANNSDIAVTTDGSGTDYLFYRIGNASVVRSNFAGSNSLFHNYTAYLVTGQMSEFAATYVGSGKTMLAYCPVNGNGLTYALTNSNGSSNGTGLLAHWTR